MIVIEKKVVSFHWECAVLNSLMFLRADGTPIGTSVLRLLDNNLNVTNNPLLAVSTLVDVDLSFNFSMSGNVTLRSDITSTKGIFRLWTNPTGDSVEVVNGFDLRFLNKEFKFNIFNQTEFRGEESPVKIRALVQNHGLSPGQSMQLTFEAYQEINR